MNPLVFYFILIKMVSFRTKILLYFFIYKYIQQYVFVKIITRFDLSTIEQTLPRIIALLTNVCIISILEIYFKSKTFKKKTIAIFTSLLIILLNVFKNFEMNNVAFFILNITICETIIYNHFLRLWEIQICVDLAILVNFLTLDATIYINNDINIPLYMLWIFSLMFLNTQIDDQIQVVSTIEVPPVITLNTKRRSGKRTRFKAIVYNILQVLFPIVIISTGCITIRYNIFYIFIDQEIKQYEIVVFLIIISLITVLSSFIIKLDKETKILITLILNFVNYLFFIIYKKFLIKYEFIKIYGFLIDICIKKLLSISKCCISTFILEAINKGEIKKYKAFYCKFFILNSDAISFIVNTIMKNYIIFSININLINIILVLTVLCTYKLYIIL